MEQAERTLDYDNPAELGQSYLYTLIRAPHLSRAILDIRHDLESMVEIMAQACDDATERGPAESIVEMGRRITALSTELDSSVVKLMAQVD